MLVAKWPVVLASVSPRRKQLLANILTSFEVVGSDVSEEDDEKQPEIHALNIANRKAKAVAQDWKDHLIIAADTIVVLDGQILGKPRNEQHACEILSKLSGATHTVITAVALLWPGGSHDFAEKSGVTFKSATAAEIEEYVKTGEPLDKAGAYGIQGMGGTLVTALKGDYENVIGLPLTRLVSELKRLGLMWED